MNKTKLLPLFVIVAVAAMMGAASIAPVYAPGKTTDTHEITEDLIGPAGPFCGSANTNLFLKVNTFEKVWDNGHAKMHLNAQFNLYDSSTEELVGTIPGIVINIQTSKDVLPLSLNINTGGAGTCTDGSPLPDIDPPGSHCGLTIQRDGDTIAHSVICVF